MSQQDLRQRLKYSAEVYGIRARSWLRLVFQVLGIGIILVGAWDVFLPLFGVSPLFTWGQPFDHAIWLTQSNGEGAVPAYVADLLLMPIGAIIAYVAN